MVQRRARRQKACLTLHRVFVVAVADVQVVADGVVGDRDVACVVVDPVVAEMIDLVV